MTVMLITILDAVHRASKERGTFGRCLMFVQPRRLPRPSMLVLRAILQVSSEAPPGLPQRLLVAPSSPKPPLSRSAILTWNV